VRGNLIVLLLFLFVTGNQGFANENLSKPLQVDLPVLQKNNSVPIKSPVIEVGIKPLKKTLPLIEHNYLLENRINLLEKQLIEQASLLKLLNNKNSVSSTENASMDFAQWTGILLGSVAIILTVLGIVIAIFSFIGYQKVKDNTEKVAKEVAEKSVIENIHKTTHDELLKVFSDNFLEKDEGKQVHKFLLDAVAKVVYRGIGTNPSWENGGDN
jgi:hypothetical protein